METTFDRSLSDSETMGFFKFIGFGVRILTD